MRVGIVQNKIIFGGRLKVVLGIIKVLNDRGIIPDVITFDTAISQKNVYARYGIKVLFKLKKIPSSLSRIPGELNLLVFSSYLKKLSEQYDFFIDSNNTSFLMPKSIPVLSYIHFPRAARFRTCDKDIHRPDLGTKQYLNPYDLYSILLSFIYKFHHLNKNNYVIANSRFTRKHILLMYPQYKRHIPVVYPPLMTTSNLFNSKISPVTQRKKSICSIGRFCREKNQMAIIRIAQCAPDWNFDLIGFSENSNEYLQKCFLHVKRMKLNNVLFHINASHEIMARILRNSLFFIHTNIKEPFGLSIAESILYGCLPIVHNSGGQVEIVPVPDLRFDSFKEVPGKITAFEKDLNLLAQYQDKLLRFVKSRFNEDNFSNDLNKVIDDFMQHHSK